MQELISLSVITGTLFLLSIILFLAGIIRRKLKLVLLSLAFLLGSVATGVYAGFRFVGKSFRMAREILKPRTGPEIYTAQFGNSPHNCSQLIHYQDQRIKRLDYTIWLHFRTCPVELQRILSLHDYETDRILTAGWPGPPEINRPAGNWFRPELLGETILLFRYHNDNGGGREIYASSDSTEVYYLDYLD